MEQAHGAQVAQFFWSVSSEKGDSTPKVGPMRQAERLTYLPRLGAIRFSSVLQNS